MISKASDRCFFGHSGWFGSDDIVLCDLINLVHRVPIVIIACIAQGGAFSHCISAPGMAMMANETQETMPIFIFS